MNPDLADLVALAEAIAVEGPPGPRGEPGEAGADGQPGTDGRDGVDGAPGQDGRDGADGAAGERGPRGYQGIDGRNGTDGAPGRDGRDGIDGQRGERGLAGLAGDRGLRGEPGAPGADGVWRGGSGSATLQVLANGVPIASQVRALDIEGPVAVSIDGAKAILDFSPAGGDLTYIHDQLVPASTWTVVHNLGKRPSVMVVTSAGDVVEGGIHYIDDNTVELSFGAPFGGQAYCN